MPRLIGPNNSILHLILMKSGAHVDIESPTILATGGQEMIKINVVGPPNLVTLVGQMIQEVAKLFLFSSADLLPQVLINGPDKLASLPDIPQGGVGYDEASFHQPLPPAMGAAGSRLGRGEHSSLAIPDIPLPSESYGYHHPPGRPSPAPPNPSSYSPQLSVDYGHMIHEQHHQLGQQSAHQYPPGNRPVALPLTISSVRVRSGQLAE
jgi:hypothetical protein